MDDLYKRKIRIRDDLPRFVSFQYGLYQPQGDSLAPILRSVALPYQVQPNGKVLCSQLLKIEYTWTPALIASAAGSNAAYFDRFVLDCVQNPASVGGGLAAWDSLTDGVAVARNPWSRPSVVGVFDRSVQWNGTAGAADNGGVTNTMLNGEKDFGVCGEFPIIPSASIGIWGFTLQSSVAANQGNTFTVATTPHVPPYDRVCRPIIGETNPSATTGANTLCTEVRGRIWYRTIELDPYQHLMVANKFKSGANINVYTQFYDKSSSLTANPNPSGAATNIWFGS